VTPARMRAIASHLLAARPWYCRTSTDVEDAMQDGYLGVAQGRRADWAIIDAMPHVRHKASGKREGMSNSLALHDAIGQMVDDRAHVVGHEDRVLAAVDARRLLERLPPRAAEMALLRWGLGLELEDIGARFGVTGSRVCQVLREARAVMRD
jgi:DNA-directed RNA polymerase specialized sigma24 family protein